MPPPRPLSGGKNVMVSYRLIMLTNLLLAALCLAVVHLYTREQPAAVAPAPVARAVASDPSAAILRKELVVLMADMMTVQGDVKSLRSQVTKLKAKAAPAAIAAAAPALAPAAALSVKEVGIARTQTGEIDIFVEPAKPMPSVQTSEEEEAAIATTRSIYGGRGDKAHLGGFTKLDLEGVTPRLWKHMVQQWNVRSVIDVGCGKGVSASWFHTHGLETQCVEGSHDAVQQSLMPADKVVEHDFTRGPWWPSTTFDAVWSVEFVEHVGRHYIHNYLPIFEKSAIVVFSHSLWGGWHHVEVHADAWWEQKFKQFGFVYAPKLTEELRRVAREGGADLTPDGKPYSGVHLWGRSLVFLNPKVAKLPRHAHLFYYEMGCFDDYKKPKIDCSGVDKLPKRFIPLELSQEQDKAWEKLVFT